MVTMAQIEELVRRIGQQFHPERIVLFGSYASGQAKNYEKTICNCLAKW
jgi:predicted nucleotidyltransferase